MGLTKARSVVYPNCQRYASTFLTEMFDSHGYAWDVPALHLYNEMRASTHESKIKEDKWWLLEVIQAEHTEMRWRSFLNDPDSDDEIDAEDEEEKALILEISSKCPTSPVNIASP